MKICLRFLLVSFLLLTPVKVICEENKSQSGNFQELQSQIKAIISDQISAFKTADIERAYRHASESIKSIFPNSKIFVTMVRKSYPMIWNPKSYEFLHTVEATEGILQRVMFTDQNGKMHFFDYALENNGNRWVIAGVFLVDGGLGA